MRRKERAISESAEIESIVAKAKICRLGLLDNEFPYVVPLCFGYKNKTLYFHSAPNGKKLDLIRKNSNVCFEIDVGARVVEGDSACKWSMAYESVIGYGCARILNDDDAKKEAVDIIMKNYSAGHHEFDEHALNRIVIIEVAIESMTGKRSGK